MSIEYIVATNIDDRVMRRAVDILKAGGLVAYPTDTTWAVGCSSDSKEGLEKLISLRGKGRRFPFTLICGSFSQMDRVSVMNDPAFRFIRQHVPGPFVFVLPAHARIERMIGVKRPEVGLRMPDHPVPLRLAEELGVPLFSVTASRDLESGEEDEDELYVEKLYEMGYEVEDIDGVELVLDTGEDVPKRLSTVVDLTGPEPSVIRAGAGELP